MVLQSNFDKAFIQVVEFLTANWSMHKKFRYRKELFNQLELHNKNWVPMKEARRHVPKAKTALIRKVLLEQYNVSPAFLDNNAGEMFTKKATWLSQPAAAAPTKDELIIKLQKEVLTLKRQNKALKKKVQDQPLKSVANTGAIIKKFKVKS